LISMNIDVLITLTVDKLNNVLKTIQTNVFHESKTDTLQKRGIMNLSQNFGYGISKHTFKLQTLIQNFLKLTKMDYIHSIALQLQ
jgi:hypothetical protein